MATHRADSFLWFHLAAIAIVPLGLEMCLVGFAIGDPLLPSSLDCLLVGLLGAVPLLALQWFRPLYPFALPLVSLRPAKLSDQQLKILTKATGLGAKVIALVGAVLGLVLLRLVYRLAPIATEVVGELTHSHNRLIGLGIAIAAFFFTNLWLQMGLGSALTLITPSGMVEKAEPFAVDAINRSFFRWGIPLSHILPAPEGAPRAPEPKESPEVETTLDSSERVEERGEAAEAETETEMTAESSSTQDSASAQNAVQDSAQEKESSEAGETVEVEAPDEGVIAPEEVVPEAIAEALEEGSPDAEVDAETAATDNNPDLTEGAADAQVSEENDPTDDAAK